MEEALKRPRVYYQRAMDHFAPVVPQHSYKSLIQAKPKNLFTRIEEEVTGYDTLTKELLCIL